MPTAGFVVLVFCTSRQKELSQLQAIWLAWIKRAKVVAASRPQCTSLFRLVCPVGTTVCTHTFGPWCLTRGSKAGREQPGVPRFKFCRAAAAKYETVPGPTGLEALSGTAGIPHGFGSACRTWNHAQPDRADPPSVALSRQNEQCQLQAFYLLWQGPLDDLP